MPDTQSNDYEDAPESSPASEHHWTLTTRQLGWVCFWTLIAGALLGRCLP